MYLWKKFDFSEKTFDEVLDTHPYVINPLKQASKFEFAAFNLAETYFFINELTKSQATTRDEHEALESIRIDMKKGPPKWAKAAYFGVAMPYLFWCGSARGSMLMKAAVFYLIYRETGAIYDVATFMRFFVYSPGYMKKLLSLDD